MQRKKTENGAEKEKVVKKYAKCERINLTLPPGTSKKLNDFIIAVASKQGKIPHGIKTKIGEIAIAEWLDKHKEDTGIQFN